MHEEICKFPSAQFYEGALQTSESVKKRPHPPFNLPFGTYRVFDLSGREQNAGTSKINDSQASFVVDVISEFHKINKGERALLCMKSVLM